MSGPASFVSQPQVVDLPKLMADVRSGHIQIPRFQRPFVWKDDRRLELLRSIRAGIPIGSLLVWRTTETQLACFERIAGLKIPRPEKGQVISYLLDGHQRLTTLIATFDRSVRNGNVVDEDEEDRPAPIYFDLEKDDFIVSDVRPTPLCLPMPLLLDAVSLRKHFRALERELGESEIARIDDLQSLAEQVLYAFQWCRIPVIPLTTDSLDLATKTFYRVNSQGMPMTEFHMISALTWGIDVQGTKLDLRKVFDEVWSESLLPRAWEPVDEQQTLSVMKGIFGMEISKAPVHQLVERIRNEPGSARQAVKLLVRAMQEASRIIASPQSLPYQMHLTLTAIALHDLAVDAPIDREFLRRWWGLATTWGSFASAASHRVTAALRHLRAGIRGQVEPWPDLLFRTTEPSPLPNLELRNARAKYFVDGYAASCGLVELLNTDGNRALVSLNKKAGNRPGNRFLWPSGQQTRLVNALESRDLDSLNGHFVDEACLDAWRQREPDRFIEHREALMNACEAEWFRGLRAEDFIAGRP
jgi:hypothetical protein